jgi:hypothetical protein
MTWKQIEEWAFAMLNFLEDSRSTDNHEVHGVFIAQQIFPLLCIGTSRPYAAMQHFDQNHWADLSWTSQNRRE